MKGGATGITRRDNDELLFPGHDQLSYFTVPSEGTESCLCGPLYRSKGQFADRFAQVLICSTANHGEKARHHSQNGAEKGARCDYVTGSYE